MHTLEDRLGGENRLSEEKKTIRQQRQRGLANRKSVGRARRLDQDFSAQKAQMSDKSSRCKDTPHISRKDGPLFLDHRP